MASTLCETGQSESLCSLDQLRETLLRHPLYGSVQSVESLRLFMGEHVFAVWDFMSLLKRLQQVVTCCEVPWIPAADPSLARFINEIVVAEESDEDGLGGYSSHFELYIAAMEDVGADTGPIQQFVAKIRQRIPIEQALAEAPIQASTREFVASTMQLTLLGQPHEVASAFFYGREDVSPDMFSRLVDRLPEQGVSNERLEHYLRRHIELDANDHGPLARKLVSSLCEGQPEKESEATTTAIHAITQRIALWDGILKEMQRRGLSPA